MNAAIDFGNTYGKVGFFEGDQLVKSLAHLDEDKLESALSEMPVTHVIASNVGKNKNDFFNKIKQRVQLLVLNHQTPVPINNLYATPETLGLDRLAGVIGANTLYPQDANLVIDMGTCITFDFIDQQTQYLGGSISPGMQMRFKSLSHFTSNLPLVDEYQTTGLIGTSTKSSIQSGVINGIKAEIEGIIHQYTKIFGDSNVIICGGDAKFFESKIKAPIFVNQDLILWGLNRILQDNVHKI